jgi:hypothetical protein
MEDDLTVEALVLSARTVVGGGLDADVARMAEQQIRCGQVQALAEKRSFDLSYLQRTHEADPEVHWMNVISLRRTDITDAHEKTPEVYTRRSKKFYYLGISVSKLVQESKNLHDLVLGCLQLFDEYEYYFASNTKQNVRFMMAKPGPLYHPVAGVEVVVEKEKKEDREKKEEKGEKEKKDEEEVHKALRTHINRWEKEVVYRHLWKPSIPCELDYVEVIFSICETLLQLYAKFMSENTGAADIHVFEGLLKIDTLIKKHVLDPVSTGLTDLATALLDSQLQEFCEVHMTSINPLAAAEEAARGQNPAYRTQPSA